VIALAITEHWVGDEDVQSTLYGQTTAYVSAGDAPMMYGYARLDDGYWSANRDAGDV
jgi:hypothetical protein